MGTQKIIEVRDGYAGLDAWLEQTGTRRILLVCDSAMPYLKIDHYFAELEKEDRVIRFRDFQPNPDYASVVKGVERFREGGCDSIIAVGGGSAIDVAKCIKLYASLDPAKNYLEQPVAPNDIPLAALPTTAGTGSEATRYAVIYDKGEKQSITHESLIPEAVIWDPSALDTLPEYQRKATMLDALCHAVESFWSLNSTEESRGYSQKALGLILQNREGYLGNTREGNAGMLEAAHTAGQAINLTQTTAGHAMCYKLTSLYGIAHGHAAALCVAQLWPYILAHTEKCIDARGEAYLKGIFAELGRLLGGRDAQEGAERFQKLFLSLGLPGIRAGEKDLAILSDSVNQTRLKNNPVRLDRKAIEEIYCRILGTAQRKGGGKG